MKVEFEKYCSMANTIRDYGYMLEQARKECEELPKWDEGLHKELQYDLNMVMSYLTDAITRIAGQMHHEIGQFYGEDVEIQTLHEKIQKEEKNDANGI